MSKEIREKMAEIEEAQIAQFKHIKGLSRERTNTYWLLTTLKKTLEEKENCSACGDERDCTVDLRCAACIESDTEFQKSVSVCEELQAENQDLEAKLRGVRGELNLLKAENEKLKADLTGEMRECSLLGEACDKLEKENQRLKEQVRDYEQALEFYDDGETYRTRELMLRPIIWDDAGQTAEAVLEKWRKNDSR